MRSNADVNSSLKLNCCHFVFGCCRMISRFHVSSSFSRRSCDLTAPTVPRRFRKASSGRWLAPSHCPGIALWRQSMWKSIIKMNMCGIGRFSLTVSTCTAVAILRLYTRCNLMRCSFTMTRPVNRGHHPESSMNFRLSKVQI